MKQEKLSGLQLFYVIVGFEMGNTLIYNLGAGAKQDAWLVILFGMIGGLVLMYVYTKLSAYYPDDTLVSMIPKIIGRFFAYPVIIIYIIYFTYLAAKACRDFGELLASTILDETPMIVVITCFMVLMIYCLRGGVEVFGRMGEVIFPVYIFSILLVWILLVTVESFTISNLSPVMGNGLQPIIKELFPTVLTFPFGESVIITMFFPFLSNKQQIRKIGMSVIIVSGVLLTMNLIMILSVLGPEVYSTQFYPLLSATRMVSIADFLERFDALIILLMVAGVFFKIGGWTFGAAIGISQIFKLRQSKSVFLGLGTIIVPLSLLAGNNQIQYNEIGLKIVTFYVHIPLQIILPIFLLCIAFIRHKYARRSV
ncbi:GerAB/ArcD/ProY family transporter [Bacillus sp. REN16]|uniref:GerAB/ArcD/ProY family transporter n=1 Tax=Bacillus sp. REN16 TaxID=2887296 RepID=UPI001E34BE8C|nr:endospore germination permease [Bacillus sp. REN16]MCC3359530.1 spore germination protein [Bacillus sp. REN16]